MERKTTSIKIDPQIWKEVRIYCIEKGMDISDYLERLLKKDLSRTKIAHLTPK